MCCTSRRDEWILCLFQRMLTCINGLHMTLKKITISLVKISGWQSSQTLHSTLNAMPLGNLKIFVGLCTWKAEQLGSMLEYHETKTCHWGDLTLKEKTTQPFLCLLIFKPCKSWSCTDILFLKLQRWIKPNTAGLGLWFLLVCVSFWKIFFFFFKKEERKIQCTLSSASFYVAVCDWARCGCNLLL